MLYLHASTEWCERSDVSWRHIPADYAIQGIGSVPDTRSKSIAANHVLSSWRIACDDVIGRMGQRFAKVSRVCSPRVDAWARCESVQRAIIIDCGKMICYYLLRLLVSVRSVATLCIYDVVLRERVLLCVFWLQFLPKFEWLTYHWIHIAVFFGLIFLNYFYVWCFLLFTVLRTHF